MNLYTKIGDSNYVINYFSKLTEQKTIPLYTSSIDDNLSYEISISSSFGVLETPIGIIDNQYPGQIFELPYTTTGIITGQRFSLIFMGLTSIEIINGCDNIGGSAVIIDNNNPITLSELYLNGQLYTTNQNDTIFNLTDGLYVYRWYNDVGENQIDFQIINSYLNFELILSQDLYYIEDAIISPVLILNGNYDEIIWDFGDGSQFIYDDINPIHQYNQLGEYLIRVTILSGQCFYYVEKIIYVNDIFGYPNIKKKSKLYIYEYGIDGRLLKK